MAVAIGEANEKDFLSTTEGKLTVGAVAVSVVTLGIGAAFTLSGYAVIVGIAALIFSGLNQLFALYEILSYKPNAIPLPEAIPLPALPALPDPAPAADAALLPGLAIPAPAAPALEAPAPAGPHLALPLPMMADPALPPLIALSPLPRSVPVMPTPATHFPPKTLIVAALAGLFFLAHHRRGW